VAIQDADQVDVVDGGWRVDLIRKGPRRGLVVAGLVVRCLVVGVGMVQGDALCSSSSSSSNSSSQSHCAACSDHE
jgi:hypothetical protein